MLSLSAGALGIFHPGAWIHNRLPRLVAGLLVGAILSGSGALTQTLFRNPLADPSILGISAGGSLGALLVLLLFQGQPPLGLLSLGAGTGAILCSALILLLGRSWGTWSPLPLILSGLVISTLIGAGISLILLYSNQALVSQFLFWTMGNLDRIRWPSLLLALGLGIAGLSFLLLRRKKLDLLILEDRMALSLGLNPGKERRNLLYITALLVGVATAMAGPLGFLGLMIPHLLRSLGYRRPSLLFPLALVTGALFLPALEGVSRALQSPIPLGVWTSFIGGVFFLFLFLSQRRGFFSRERLFGPSTGPQTPLQKNEPILSFQKVGLVLENKEILRDIDFTLYKGQCLTVIGPNGSGKTTVLDLAAGFMEASQGQVLWSALPLKSFPAQEAGSYRSYYPVQEAPDLPFSALERILMGGKIPLGQSPISAQENQKKGWAKEYLKGLGIDPNQRYSSLSRGQKDMVRWGAQILQDSSLLILDEPGAHLDGLHKAFFYQGLEQLTSEGKSVLISAQDLGEVPAFCNQILVLENGRALYNGPKKSFSKKTLATGVSLISAYPEKTW